jgi:hypothetical protein
MLCSLADNCPATKLYGVIQNDKAGCVCVKYMVQTREVHRILVENMNRWGHLGDLNLNGEEMLQQLQTNKSCEFSS